MKKGDDLCVFCANTSPKKKYLIPVEDVNGKKSVILVSEFIRDTVVEFSKNYPEAKLIISK